MILRMVEQGKISAEEGARLLAALGQAEPAAEPPPSPRPANSRTMRIRVSDAVTDQQKVAVNLPLSLVSFGLRFVPKDANVDVQAVREALDSGLAGRIVEVLDEEEGRRVEIFVE
jgi:hypothetical protein